jgi:hypothetical protein
MQYLCGNRLTKPQGLWYNGISAAQGTCAARRNKKVAEFIHTPQPVSQPIFQ